jgi:hypothetical protein
VDRLVAIALLCLLYAMDLTVLNLANTAQQAFKQGFTIVFIVSEVLALVAAIIVVTRLSHPRTK